MSIQAVIFDLDGTLVDANEAHIDAWWEAFHVHGHSVDLQRIRPEIGKGGDRLVADILGDGEERRIGNSLRAAHDRNFTRIAGMVRLRTFPGSVELIESLRIRDMATAIATSSKRSAVRETFESTEIDFESLVDHVVTGDEGRTKPSPDLLLAALDKLKLGPDQCVYVGDTVHDAEAAAKAGMPFVGLTCGRCASAEQLSAAGALFVWTGPLELLENLPQVLAVAAVEQG